MISLDILKPLWGFCKRHATKILCGLAIGSEAAALYLTAKEAPVVQEAVKELPEGSSGWDRFKTSAKIYIPAWSMAAVSFASIIGGTVIGEKRLALVEGLCSVAQASAAKYQSELVKHAGTEKARQAEDELGAQQMRDNPVDKANIYATGKGDQLFYDPLSGRYFTSSWDEIEKAVIRLNKSIINGIWVTVNEWYTEIGLEGIGLGETSGWNVDHLLDIGKYATMTMDDRSCLVLSYYQRPVRYK